MAGRRTYADRAGSPARSTSSASGGRLLIVRELLLGPKRFTDLRTGLPLVGPDILSQRLRELEQAGVVRRGTLPPPAGSRVYELTDRGRELEPVILALGRWGSSAPFPDTDQQLSVDAFAVALKTVFDPSAASGIDATYGLEISGQPFRARVTDGALALRRGEGGECDATIAGSPEALARVLWHGEDLESTLRTGGIAIGGDVDQVRRFLGLFGAPAPASAAT